jgi:hypothetical protein
LASAQEYAMFLFLLLPIPPPRELTITKGWRGDEKGKCVQVLWEYISPQILIAWNCSVATLHSAVNLMSESSPSWSLGKASPHNLLNKIVLFMPVLLRGSQQLSSRTCHSVVHLVPLSIFWASSHCSIWLYGTLFDIPESSIWLSPVFKAYCALSDPFPCSWRKLKYFSPQI